MRSLLLTTLDPFPADNGGKITTVGVANYLSSLGAVDLLCLGPKSAHYAMQNIDVCTYKRAGIVANENKLRTMTLIFGSMLKRKPYTVQKFWSQRLAQHVLQGISQNRWDFIYVDHLPMGSYIPDGVNFILDENNVEWTIMQERANQTRKWWERQIFSSEARALRRWEVISCNKASIVFTVSEFDKQALTSLGVEARIDVLPVQLGESWPSKSEVSATQDATCVGIIGALTWRENLDAVHWYIDNIVPRVKGMKVRSLVAGRGALQTICQTEDIDVWDSLDIAEVTRRIDILAVPLQGGGGIRIKILQALEAGVPIVSTSKGAEGLPGVAPIEIADTPDNFADAVVRIAGLSPIDRQKLKNEGKEYYQRYFSRQKFESVFSKALEVCVR